MAKVNTYVVAHNPDGSESVLLAPGDEAPSWAKLGDHVFDEPQEAEDDSPTDLSKLTVAELTKLAESKGVKVPVDAKKADIISMIETV